MTENELDSERIIQLLLEDVSEDEVDNFIQESGLDDVDHQRF